MSKHTPGPWVVDDSVCRVSVNNPVERKHIALVNCGLGEKECYSAAHLIAAAPDLLKACQKAFDELNAAFAEYGTSDADTLRKVLFRAGRARARLVAAIAKAEGQQDQ